MKNLLTTLAGLSLFINAIAAAGDLSDAELEAMVPHTVEQQADNNRQKSYQDMHEEIYHKARKQWLISNTFAAGTGYDTNLNYAPDTAGLKEYDTATWDASWNMKAFRFFLPKTSAAVATGVSQRGVFRDDDLNSTHAYASLELEHAINQKWLLGISGGLGRVNQEEMLDQRQVLLASDYSNYYYSLGSSLDFIPNEHWTISASYAHSLHDFDPTRTAGRFSQDNDSDSINLNIMHNWGKWAAHVGYDYFTEDYSELPAILLTGLPDSQAKEEYVDHSFYASLSRHMGHWLPALSYKYTMRDDEFQGFENYDSHVIGGDINHFWNGRFKHQTKISVSYEYHDFDKRPTFNASGDAVEFDNYNAAIMHTWRITPKLSLDFTINYETRDSNEAQLIYDRHYDKLTFRTGIRY